MPQTRTETDSMGPMQVPADALYGASTARAVANFPIANRPLPPVLIHALGHVKAACALANQALGKLPDALAQAIVQAADEVAQGQHDAHFPVDVYQTGSGTSTNMNANEVIATRANQLLQESHGSQRSQQSKDSVPKGQLDPTSRGPVHPNDHVNMGQSSNDVFPTAMHVAGAMALHKQLVPALDRLQMALAEKAEAWDGLVKVGRTHLMDATPIRFGQVFAGYAKQAEHAMDQATLAADQDLVASGLPIGGTAVGTGLNTHAEFSDLVCQHLAERTGLGFYVPEGLVHTERQAAKDAFVLAHGRIKTIAVALSKIASDIRLLGSGPRCGIGELNLPAVQPGSSIMPGKVNPVMCESVVQVACRVLGNDQTITTAGLGGVGSIFELNVCMPVIVDAFLESVALLANVSNLFVGKLLDGLAVNETKSQALLDQSLMTVTALAPDLGYDRCAQLAKQALKQGRTLRELVLEAGLMDATRLDRLLDPMRMTEPDESDL